MAFSNRIFFEYVGSSLLLFILTGCSGNLTSSAPASDDDEFSSSAPIQISGTYLTYDNSKVRCSYEVVGDVYTTTCDAVASVFGFEVVPVGVAEGVSFDWNEPETLKGLGFVESRDCRVENELKQICDLKIPNGNAEFLFNASVSAGHKSKKEDFKMDVAFSVNLIAGQNADLPYYASEQEAQVELKLTSDLNEATQKKAGFNYRSVSAFSGAILNSISDMCTVDSRTYYASEDSIYTVTNDRVELFVSPRRSASADGKISSVLKNCSVQSDCEIKLACGNKGIYVSERSAQALFYLGRNGRASQIDVSSVGLSIGVDAFTPSSMKISKDGTLYVLNNQKSIFKLTGSSLVHIVGGAKPIDYDALSAASLKDLKPTETDFSEITNIDFNNDGNLEFMDSVAGRNTHWTLKDGKLQIKSTGVSGLEDSFKEYYQRDLGGMTFVANVSGRTYYLFENSHKSTERIALVSFEGGLGYLPLKDNPKLAFLNSTPMHNTPLLRGKGVFSDSKNLYLFGSLKGIVKINPSEQTFEMVAGSPSKDAAVANTPENFNAEGLKKFQSGVPIESIGDVQSIVETKDEETVYLDHELGLVMKIDKNGLMSVFAGGGSSRNISSGKTSELQLSGPYGLIQREDGSFLVADSGNNRIVSIKDGFFQTFAGATASSGGNLVSRPNEGSCLSDPTNALGAKIVGPGGMVEDKASKAIYVSLYQPSCVQKITTDGILHTVIGNGQAVQSPDGSVAKDSTVRQPTDVALSSAGELLITEFGEYVEDDGEFVFEEIKIPARIIAIDVNSEQPLLKVISTQIISENRYDRSPYITPASIATGPGGEIFVADVHTFKKDISVLKRQSDGSYKKVSIIERDDGVDCVVGGLSDVSKNNALASSIKTSTSNICTGYPVKLHVHDTCDQADGKVSLTFSQRFFKRDRYLTWSSYSLTNGNSIYKISWPCSADLFAE